MKLQDLSLNGFTEISDNEASMISGGITVEVYGPKPFVERAGTGFILGKPGLEKNILGPEQNGFAGDQAQSNGNKTGWDKGSFTV